MNHEFYDLLHDEENMDLLDEILDLIEAGVEDEPDVQILTQKIDTLEENGEVAVVEKLHLYM